MKQCPQGTPLETALLWLRTNDGAEAADCQAIADWLEAFAFDQMVKQEARKAGLPVAKVRQRIAQQQGGSR